MKTGKGKIVVNRRPVDKYFGRATLRMIIGEPFEKTDTVGKYDIAVNVKGGGLSGQAGAVRLGISRALLQVNPELRQVLKKAGLLTRDSRMAERKKYGLRGARRAFQFSKR